MDIDDSSDNDEENDDDTSSHRDSDEFVVHDDSDDQDKVMDVQIYDRFPKQDYPESPLPYKVEWFAFPEGSVNIWAAERYNIP